MSFQTILLAIYFFIFIAIHFYVQNTWVRSSFSSQFVLFDKKIEGGGRSGHLNPPPKLWPCVHLVKFNGITAMDNPMSHSLRSIFLSNIPMAARWSFIPPGVPVQSIIASLPRRIPYGPAVVNSSAIYRWRACFRSFRYVYNNIIIMFRTIIIYTVSAWRWW